MKKESQIKHLRFQNRLKDVIAEAISTLNDKTANSVVVLEARVSRGKYDADIFLDGSSLNAEERKNSIKALKKASNYIKEYCKRSEDWFKIPKLHFKFDDSLLTANRIDELFEKIKNKEV